MALKSLKRCILRPKKKERRLVRSHMHLQLDSSCMPRDVKWVGLAKTQPKA